MIHDANNWGADLFLSIHCNSFHQEQANGTETLVHPNSSAGSQLGKCLQNQMIGEFGLINRGVKPRTDLRLINDTAMPAALA